MADLRARQVGADETDVIAADQSSHREHRAPKEATEKSKGILELWWDGFLFSLATDHTDKGGFNGCGWHSPPTLSVIIRAIVAD